MPLPRRLLLPKATSGGVASVEFLNTVTGSCGWSTIHRTNLQGSSPCVSTDGKEASHENALRRKGRCSVPAPGRVENRRIGRGATGNRARLQRRQAGRRHRGPESGETGSVREPQQNAVRRRLSFGALAAMAERKLKIWYEREGDFLEAMFERRPGVFRETANPHVMQKIDDQGKVLGFSIMRVSALQDAPLEVAL